MGHKVHVYPHNDLLNLAYYHLKVVEDKIDNGSEDALALDCMSGLIALAFSLEAFVNFVGKKRVKNWREKRGFRKKITDACEAVGLHFDPSLEPYSTIWQLKQLRDSLAHGKPEDFSVAVKTGEELKEAMSTSWDKYLTVDFFRQAYSSIKEFQWSALERGKISMGETLTSATGRIDK